MRASGNDAERPIEALHEIVVTAAQQGDLDAFLALLVLQTGFGRPADSPWAGIAQELLNRSKPPTPLRRPHDVAVAGISLVLGATPEAFPDYPAAAGQELARQPLPPAACVRDDERLLLGVSAGIGKAAIGVRPTLLNLLSPRAATVPPRQRILDLWAEALSLGEPRLTTELAGRLMRYLQTMPERHATLTDGDRIAIFWAAARLLEAPWKPADDDFRTLDILLADGRRSAFTLISRERLSPLDAALLLDALSAAPHDRVALLTALDVLMRVIDQFPTAVHVLQHRQRSRPPYLINDEYDAQDLFRALALAALPDLVPEDPASKVADKGSRLDFTSRSARLGVELKFLRGHADLERVRQEVLVDESTYQMHPYIEAVVVLVHDPHGVVPPGQRVSFEADLSQSVSVAGRSVRYFTRIR